MKVYILNLSESPDGGCIAKDFSSIQQELENMEKGEVMTIEVAEMTEEEYELLPEFEGW